MFCRYFTWKRKHLKMLFHLLFKNYIYIRRVPFLFLTRDTDDQKSFKTVIIPLFYIKCLYFLSGNTIKI